MRPPLIAPSCTHLVDQVLVRSLPRYPLPIISVQPLTPSSDTHFLSLSCLHDVSTTDSTSSRLADRHPSQPLKARAYTCHATTHAQRRLTLIHPMTTGSSVALAGLDNSFTCVTTRTSHLLQRTTSSPPNPCSDGVDGHSWGGGAGRRVLKWRRARTALLYHGGGGALTATPGPHRCPCFHTDGGRGRGPSERAEKVERMSDDGKLRRREEGKALLTRRCWSSEVRGKS